MISNELAGYMLRKQIENFFLMKFILRHYLIKILKTIPEWSECMKSDTFLKYILFIFL